jgi:hypothetical protein
MPVEREEIHFRRIDMRGYGRSDGLYEVEGRVSDRKARDFRLFDGQRVVPAHEPVHDMGVRLVFDEAMVVHEVQTFTDAAPYPVCSEGGRALQAIKGLAMTSGWSKEVRSRLGGARSCTHLMEILIPLATVAFQTLSQRRQTRPVRLNASGLPVKIDSCFAYAADGELVQRLWPQSRSKPADAE